MVTELLTIGVGYLGRTISELGPREPFELSVRGLGRTPSPGLLTADVTSLSSLKGAREACPSPSAIAYCVSPDGGHEDAYLSVYERGVQNVQQTWPEARLALISSTVVFGGGPRESFDDFTEPRPDSPSAYAVLRGEELVLQQSQRNLVVRAGGIYGPGRVNLLRRLLSQELSPEEAARVTSRVHVRDLARIVLTLVTSPETFGTYVATDPTPAALGEIQRTFRDHRANEILRALGPPGERAVTRRGLTSRRIVPRRLLELGFSFEFPSFREGYGAILDSYLPPPT
jgi:nucleoside-diphosphate-sugar epimerase